MKLTRDAGQCTDLHDAILILSLSLTEDNAAQILIAFIKSRVCKKRRRVNPSPSADLDPDSWNPPLTLV